MYAKTVQQAAGADAHERVWLSTAKGSNVTRVTTSAHLARLRSHAAGTLHYLSNPLKPERERAVCRAFLRSIGIRFTEREIIAPCQEPVDVCFRDARFQVRDLLLGRRRGDEWKRRQVRWNRARSVSGTLERAVSLKPMRRAELVDAVTEALESKSKKYGLSGCAQVDALVYADLTGSRFLMRWSVSQDVTRLHAQGWRSVSVLFPPYGIVILARDTAPDFIRRLIGRVRKTWRKPDGLFDV